MRNKNLVLFLMSILLLRVTPIESQSVKDIEGNVYKTVTIGKQVWMSENLKATKYSNGDLIGTTSGPWSDISKEITPKYQWVYDGKESNESIYGRLYTLFAVTDKRNVCPVGWHVPSRDDVMTLREYLENKKDFIGHAKPLASSYGWPLSTKSGTIGNGPQSNNSSGFTALPGGYRDLHNSFNYIGIIGSWWCTTETFTDGADTYNLNNDSQYLGMGSDRGIKGLSVRCVKNY